MAGAQRFRFRDESGPGADGDVLEVRVPQVRAVAHPRGITLWLECREWGTPQFPASFGSIRFSMKPDESLNMLQ